MKKKDHRIGVALTPALESFLATVLESQVFSSDVKSAIEAEMTEGYVTHTSLSTIQCILSDDRSVFDACRGSKLVFIGRKPPAKTNDETKEYLQRKAELLRRDEERQYNMMVFGTEKPPAKTEGVKKTFASALDQAAIGVNMVVSTGAAFGIGYYFAGYYSTDVAIRMAIGTTAGTAAMVLEMVLFIARAARTS